MEHRYRPDVLARLERHGIRPRLTTRPELVREFVNDLYRYEIRRLRDRLRRGEFPKHTYIDRVVALRNAYSVLALKAEEGGPIYVFGSAELLDSLLAANLVDEYRLVVHPFALGKGLPIFDGLEKIRAFKLVSSSTFPAGATAHIFTRER